MVYWAIVNGAEHYRQECFYLAAKTQPTTTVSVRVGINFIRDLSVCIRENWLDSWLTC